MDNNFEPLRDGWFKPRETARYLIDHASTKYIIFLMSILTIASATLQGNNVNDTNVDVLWIIFILVVILSPFYGAITFAIGAFIMWTVGKIVKGEGSFKDLFKALIGANIPVLLAFPFMLTWAILEPQSYLNDELLTGSPIEIIASLVLLISSIWSLINMIIAISEAHRFSIGKSLFTVFVPIIVLIALLVTLAIILIG